MGRLWRAGNLRDRCARPHRLQACRPADAVQAGDRGAVGRAGGAAAAGGRRRRAVLPPRRQPAVRAGAAALDRGAPAARGAAAVGRRAAMIWLAIAVMLALALGLVLTPVL